MAIQPTGLGKGLDALIRETQEPVGANDIRFLPLTDIIPNPLQPRRHFQEKALEELAASIKSQGLLQPLLVRPIGPTNPGKFEIVAGERRWRASQLAGLTEVPVFIKALSQQDTLAAALIENLQREDLNPIEEAQGLLTLKEEFGLSQDDLAQKIGKSRSAIANSLRLLSLPEATRVMIAEGRLSSGHARALLTVTEERAQEYLKNLILENRLSVREAEGLAAGWKQNGQFELAGVVSPEDGKQPSAPQAAAKRGDKAASGAKPQSSRMLDIQNTISELFSIPVKVTGKETKGRISFAYSSPEELEALIARLAGVALPGTSLISLPSDEKKALVANEKEELPHEVRAAVTGSVAPELESAQHTALEGARSASLEGGAAAAQLEGRKDEAIEHTERRALGASTAAKLAASPEKPVLESAGDEAQEQGADDMQEQSAGIGEEEQAADNSTQEL